jgi:hypothetical protein
VLWYVLAQGGGASQSKLLALAGAGCVLLAAAMVVGWPRLVALAVLLLAAPDAVVLAMRGPIPLAPVLAAGLLGASELAYWSAELRAGGRDVRFALALRLAVRLLAMAAVGAALGLLLLAVAELPASGSLDLTVLGAVAVVAVVGLAAWLVMASVGGGAGSGES